MSLRFSNFGKAIVASAPSGLTGLSFTVEIGKGALFPTLGTGDYFYGIFKDASGNREIVKITGRSGDSMTIATGGRGLDGTTARTWAAGDYFVAGLVNVALEESISSPILSSVAGLSPTPDTFAYFTGPSASALTPLTSFARELLSDSDALSMRTRLGAAGQAFAAGTRMLFYNASAPLGWTHDPFPDMDHTLRVVPGGGLGGTFGGTVGFSSVFKLQSVAGTVGATTLSEAQIPAHRHSISIYDPETGNTGVTAGGPNAMASQFTNYTGGGGSHTHSFSGTSINLSVKYINIIIATKD